MNVTGLSFLHSFAVKIGSMKDFTRLRHVLPGLKTKHNDRKMGMLEKLDPSTPQLRSSLKMVATRHWSDRSRGVLTSEKNTAGRSASGFSFFGPAARRPAKRFAVILFIRPSRLEEEGTKRPGECFFSFSSRFLILNSHRSLRAPKTMAKTRSSEWMTSRTEINPVNCHIRSELLGTRRQKSRIRANSSLLDWLWISFLDWGGDTDFAMTPRGVASSD